MKESKKQVEQFISEHYRNHTNKELAEALSRQGIVVATSEVQGIIRRMGLSRKIDGKGALPGRIREVESLTLSAERTKESAVYKHAIKEWEAALELFGKKRYPAAEKAFRETAVKYSATEPELAERARAYAKTCARLSATAEISNPRTFEDFYRTGLGAFNAGKMDEAEKLLGKALDKASDSADKGAVNYALASLEAKREDASASAQFLEKAIAEDARYRAQFRHDMDFADLVFTPEFRAIIASGSKAA